MQTIEDNLFDDPTWVIGFLIVAAVILGASVYFRGRPKPVFLIIPVALAGAAFALDLLVETDRELIERVVYEMAEDFEAGRVDNIERRISDNYSGFNNTKEGLVGAMRSRRRQVSSVKLSGIDIRVSGKRADMNIQTTIKAGSSMGSRTLGIWWEVHWAKLSSGWCIEKVSPPQFGIPGL
jgi:hypothetical protein